jgi:hypothetical protein
MMTVLGGVVLGVGVVAVAALVCARAVAVFVDLWS